MALCPPRGNGSIALTSVDDTVLREVTSNIPPRIWLTWRIIVGTELSFASHLILQRCGP